MTSVSCTVKSIRQTSEWQSMETDEHCMHWDSTASHCVSSAPTPACVYKHNRCFYLTQIIGINVNYKISIGDRRQEINALKINSAILHTKAQYKYMQIGWLLWNYPACPSLVEHLTWILSHQLHLADSRKIFFEYLQNHLHHQTSDMESLNCKISAECRR